VPARAPAPSPLQAQPGARPAARPRGNDEAARAAELRRMQRRATGLLAAVTVAFVVVALWAGDDGWAGYARAAAEGSMVGGLADWFAVTALFRHPLGLPIPHTAVIRERKEQFGATLGSFVQQNFLSPEVVGERLRASNIAGRAAAWLSTPANAAIVAGSLSDLLVTVTDGLHDDEVHELLDEELRRAVGAVPLSPLAGRALRMATTERRHQEVLDAFLRGLERYLDEHDQELRERLERQSPWWLPGAAQDRLFARVAEGVHELVHAVNTDPDHELRLVFDERVAVLVERLEHDPELRARGEQLKADLLAHPELRAWSSSLWADAKVALRTQAADPSSRLRSRLADAVVATGARLSSDAALRARAERAAETGVRYVAEHYHDEIADLVSGTISRWDAEETSRKLELLLGRDLQFIRINGTVVGGLAGLAIHAFGQALG
jgi:uncharacterized membrane-anchored protein YjiN (DUF445 family)